LTLLHFMMHVATESLFRMVKNGVGGGMVVRRGAYTSLSKSIPHPHETIKKFNFGLFALN